MLNGGFAGRLCRHETSVGVEDGYSPCVRQRSCLVHLLLVAEAVVQSGRIVNRYRRLKRSSCGCY